LRTVAKDMVNRLGTDPVLDPAGGLVDDHEHMRHGQPKEVLPVGKLPLEYLRSLLRQAPKLDPRLLIGPQIGEDAAVIDAGDRYLVVATDPVTFATDHIGCYAVHVNANDVAVLGARPLWFFVVMLLPEGRTTPELAETIMADVRTTCDELGVTLAGGHTEITPGLDRPILVGQMLGEVAPTRLVRKTRIAIGDRILLTRGVAIEGTAILAREKSEWLRDRIDADVLARAARFLIEPGISVVSAALTAASVGEAVHAMHDPTEGGLATGLFELVAPAGLGLRVVGEHIRVLPETGTICRVLGLDPLKLIASGALLVAVAPDQVDAVLTVIQTVGIPAAVIGEVRPSSEGVTIVTNGNIEPLTPAVRDEISRAFEGS
jgi:hydrogenase expression/formation protein HypE